MTKPTIIDQNPISMSEVKDLLVKIKKRDNELNFRANKTEEYFNHFKILSKSKVKECYQKIEDLKITRLKTEYIIKIIDIMPRSIDELKVVMQSFAVTLTKDNLKQILSTIKEFQ